MKTLKEIENEPSYTYVLYWLKLSKWNDPKDMFPVYCDYINNNWHNLNNVQQRIFYACMHRLYGKYGLKLNFEIEKPAVDNIINLDDGSMHPLREISEDEEYDEFFREMGLVFDNFKEK